MSRPAAMKLRQLTFVLSLSVTTAFVPQPLLASRTDSSLDASLRPLDHASRGAAVAFGAVATFGALLAPELSFAATSVPAPVEVTKSSPKQKAAAPKKAPEPKEKTAVDNAKASLTTASQNLKLAQTKLSETQTKASKSAGVEKKADEAAKAAKQAFLKANDKLSQLKKDKSGASDKAIEAQKARVGKYAFHQHRCFPYT